MQAQMLAPAAVLVLWSLIMLGWMVATRFPAMAKAGIDLGKGPPGGRGQNLDGLLPDSVNWKAHNFTHLMEQPTLFYATVVTLALTGAGALDVLLAWIYVALRVVHSIWQATVNRIPVRFYLFGVSTLVLAILAVRAVLATILYSPATVTG